MNGIELIAAERQRQIEGEGWTPEQDDGHVGDELAKAAACYAIPIGMRRRATVRCGDLVDLLWPWTLELWKPSPEDRERELVKAGALIAAEIDRLQRSEATA